MILWVVGPGSGTRRGGLGAGQAAVVGEAGVSGAQARRAGAAEPVRCERGADRGQGASGTQLIQELIADGCHGVIRRPSEYEDALPVQREADTSGPGMDTEKTNGDPAPPAITSFSTAPNITSSLPTRSPMD